MAKTWKYDGSVIPFEDLEDLIETFANDPAQWSLSGIIESIEQLKFETVEQLNSEIAISKKDQQQLNYAKQKRYEEFEKLVSFIGILMHRCERKKSNSSKESNAYAAAAFIAGYHFRTICFRQVEKALSIGTNNLKKQRKPRDKTKRKNDAKSAIALFSKPGRKQEMIMKDAAKSLGISTQTLYRWLS